MNDGLRDELITAQVDRELREIGIERARIKELEPGEGRVRLARHLADAASRLIADIDSADELDAEIANVNRLLTAVHEDRDDAAALHLVAPATKLTGIYPVPTGVAKPYLPDHPVIPLTDAELLSNAPGQPNLGQLVRQECQSALRVDLLCAFVGPTGVHTLLDALEQVVERGRARGIENPVRVITSTWLGATKRRALDMLSEIGAEVFVVYDGARLRLHAKSWRFERSGGLSTAYVGSSNLSKSALELGLEWNVRVSERTNPGVVERIHQTFDAYLDDDQFERYDPARDAERLDEALAFARGRGAPRRLAAATATASGTVRPRPYPYQQRILEELHAARHRHDRHRNLVVSATGTGKTVIAAFDYAALAKQARGPLPSLLFVAHREDILQQSRTTFRSVLGRPEFGEILAGGHQAPTGRHVFANIQSLNEKRLATLGTDDYDVIIIDEFHHAAADSYRRLIDRVQPRELVGLTATPERADGQDVTAFFAGHITSELRLWEAIDQGLLAPFHYFGIDDQTDLSVVRWSRGRYDAAQLGNVLSGDRKRVKTLLTAMTRYLPSVDEMRALGFCVSIDHARFMAEEFTARGIESAYVYGETPPSERRALLDRLEQPDDPLRCVFSVDVLGEGVDVPDVDTLLLLRPTESATVFLQQLGRGLRLSETKDALTVVDMVGIPHERFRFDRALRTIIDPAGGSVKTQAELGFPFLPSGCEIFFEKRAHDRVLANLRKQVGTRQWKQLVEELRVSGPSISLADFLDRTERDVEHLYFKKGASWGALRVAAGYQQAPPEDLAGRHDRLYTLLHVDDEERTSKYVKWLSADEPPVWADISTRERRLLDMLLVGLWSTPRTRPERARAIELLWSDKPLRRELIELFAILEQRAQQVTVPLDPGGANPARAHARYTKEEGLIAYGKSSYEQAPPLQTGVYRAEDERSDFFFVTLRKDEKTFSPETRYRDFALGPRRFHWETQHDTKVGDAKAQRYIGHAERGDHIGLFVRETSKAPSGAGEPFTFLGRCTYQSHESSAPVQIVWELEHPMPAELLEVARLVAG